MMRGLKIQNEQLAHGKSEQKQPEQTKPAETKPATAEEKKETKPSSKSPFQKPAGQSKEKGAASPPHKFDDEIEEDIIQDIEDIQFQQNSARDYIAASGGAASSSAVGVDQSVDTLNYEEFDHIEDVKITPRK